MLAATNGHEYGVFVYEGGRGTFEDNDLTGNRHGAWHIDHHIKHNVVRSRNRE